MRLLKKFVADDLLRDPRLIDMIAGCAMSELVNQVSGAAFKNLL